MITAPTSRLISLGVSSKRIAWVGQIFSQTPHLPFFSQMQRPGSMLYFKGTAWG